MPTSPAPHHTRQQGGPVPDRADRFGARPVRRHPPLVRLELVPTDVRRVPVSQEDLALLRSEPAAAAALGTAGLPATRIDRAESIDVSSCIDRVAEDVADGLPARRPPVQLPTVGPAAPT